MMGGRELSECNVYHVSWPQFINVFISIAIVNCWQSRGYRLGPTYQADPSPVRMLWLAGLKWCHEALGVLRELRDQLQSWP